jgi:S1-C subfamily serine protease
MIAVPRPTGLEPLGTPSIPSPRARWGFVAEDAPDDSGARLKTVHVGSAADEAGLKVGDIVTAVGQGEIVGALSLQVRIAGVEPGQRHWFLVKRGSNTQLLSVTPRPLMRARFGVGFVDRNTGEVAIQEVVKGLPGETSGLKQGDIVRSIDGVPAPDVDTTMTILSDAPPGRAVQFAVRRDNHDFLIAVTPVALPASSSKKTTQPSVGALNPDLKAPLQ